MWGLWVRVGATLLLVGAGLLALSAIAAMQRALTPIHPAATPRSLVTHGPFRFTRNPIYLALAMIMAAGALVFNSLWFVLAVPILVLLINVLVIPREERALSMVFGAEYLSYQGRVRRWL